MVAYKGNYLNRSFQLKSLPAHSGKNCVKVVKNDFAPDEDNMERLVNELFTLRILCVFWAKMAKKGTPLLECLDGKSFF